MAIRVTTHLTCDRCGKEKDVDITHTLMNADDQSVYNMYATHGFWVRYGGVLCQECRQEDIDASRERS